MTPGAKALEATVELLGRFKGAPIEVEWREASVLVKPMEPDTFPITLYDHGEDAMVSADRWHTHYDDPMQAAFCVMWLLTPYYRMVQELKAGVLVATWIERYEATGWEAFEPVYFLNPEDAPSWTGDFKRRYSQQMILPSPRPYSELCVGAVLDEEGLPPDACHGSWVVEVGAPLAPSLHRG